MVIKRNRDALQSLHIIQHEPLCVVICEPQLLEIQASRVKQDTLYIDFSGDGVRDIPDALLLPSKKKGTYAKMRDIKHLFMCNDFIGTDDGRNGGGNLLLSETLCVISGTLRVMESKLERLFDSSISRIFLRVVSDYDTAIITSVLRHLYGSDMTLGDYAAIRWREWKSGKQPQNKIWYFLCNGHFNVNIERRVMLRLKGYGVSKKMMHIFVLSELRLWQKLQSIEHNIKDWRIPFRVEAMLNAYEWLITTDDIPIDANITINNVMKVDAYQSVCGLDFVVDVDIQHVFRDKVDVEPVVDEKNEQDPMSQNDITSLLNIASDDNDTEYMECFHCGAINFAVRDGPDQEFVQVECGKCGLLSPFKFSSSIILKKIPITIQDVDNNKQPEIVDYILIKYRCLSISGGITTHRYIWFFNYTKTQQVIDYDNKPDILKNPWCNIRLSTSIQHFFIAPLILPSAEPMKMRTSTNTYRTNQAIEKSIDLRKKKAGRKKKSIFVYTQETHEYMMEQKKFMEIIYKIGKVHRVFNKKRLNKEQDIHQLGLQETTWNRTPGKDAELMNYIHCFQKKFGRKKLSHAILALQGLGCNIDMKWFQNAVNAKNEKDPLRQAVISTISMCNIKPQSKHKK